MNYREAAVHLARLDEEKWKWDGKEIGNEDFLNLIQRIDGKTEVLRGDPLGFKNGLVRRSGSHLGAGPEKQRQDRREAAVSGFNIV